MKSIMFFSLLFVIVLTGCKSPNEAVTTLEIKSPTSGKQILLAENDFSNKLTWDEAKVACENMGPGWRLPTVEELIEMYKSIHLKGKGNFKPSKYWSNVSVYNNTSIHVDFSNGNASGWGADKWYHYNVRAVKDL